MVIGSHKLVGHLGLTARGWDLGGGSGSSITFSWELSAGGVVVVHSHRSQHQVNTSGSFTVTGMNW